MACVEERTASNIHTPIAPVIVMPGGTIVRQASHDLGLMTQIAGLRRFPCGMAGETSDREGASHVPRNVLSCFSTTSPVTSGEPRAKQANLSCVASPFFRAGSCFSSTSEIRLFNNRPTT